MTRDGAERVLANHLRESPFHQLPQDEALQCAQETVVTEWDADTGEPEPEVWAPRTPDPASKDRVVRDAHGARGGQGPYQQPGAAAKGMARPPQQPQHAPPQHVQQQQQQQSQQLQVRGGNVLQVDLQGDHRNLIQSLGPEMGSFLQNQLRSAMLMTRAIQLCLLRAC